MPVKRRVAKLRRRDFAAGVWEILLDLPLPPEANRFLKHAGSDTWRAWWRTAGPEVLAEWTRRRPGTRPSTWWRFIAPEPRRTIANGRDLIESEASYLRRLDLLLPGEERRLRPDAFAPVPRPRESWETDDGAEA
jgi:hypothetical protein